MMQTHSSDNPRGRAAASFVVGVGVLVVGLVLERTAGGVELPVIALDKVGLVLAVLGGLEAAASLLALVWPSGRAGGAGRAHR